MITSLKNRVSSKLILLLLTLSILVSSLSACYLFETPTDSKENISATVENATVNDNAQYVAHYLEFWGLPSFKLIKFLYIEEKVNQYYNYADGLPDTFTHAKETAKLFLENYYDEINLNDKSEVTDALLTCYARAIGDPYTIYRPPVEADEFTQDMSGKFGGIGVIVAYNHDEETIMVETVYINSPAEKAGIKPGDYFYAIDGVTVEELGYLQAVNYVRGKIGTSVQLTMIRDGEFVEVTAIRDEVEEINVSYKIDPDTKIGYVQIVQFKGNTYSQFVEAIDYLEENGAVGIVFDLRGNPGGYLNSVTAVISYLIPNGNTVVSYQYKGKGTTVYTTMNDDENGDHVVDLPFVVICDEMTASAGEIFTAAIRDYRNEGMLDATIVGVNTYKKGIMQNTYSYTDGSSITLTVAYYNPPCGVNYHGVGVTPDVLVENTSKEVDLQLEAAYAEMQKLLINN